LLKPDTKLRFASIGPTTEIVSGTTVRLTLTNNATLDHEMQLLDANGRLIDRIERIALGASGQVRLPGCTR
jgi:hypothetical protein